MAWHGKGLTFLMRRGSGTPVVPSSAALLAAVSTSLPSGSSSGEHTPPVLRHALSATASPGNSSRRNVFDEVASPSPPMTRPPSVRAGIATPVESTLPRLVRSARLQAVLLHGGASPSPGAANGRRKGGIAFAGALLRHPIPLPHNFCVCVCVLCVWGSTHAFEFPVLGCCLRDCCVLALWCV